MYEGLGIDTSSKNFKLKLDAEVTLWKKAMEYEVFREDFKNYCSNFNLDEPNKDKNIEDYVKNHKDDIEDYVENYEDTTSNTGFEGLLAAVINEAVDPVHMPFVYEDYCIVVPASIPANDKEKAAMLTQQKIQKILAEYVNPLIEEPVIISWLEIND